jgi:phospholipid/cholesterol/gamma-HCH transport system substrate-binding protein
VTRLDRLVAESEDPLHTSIQEIAQTAGKAGVLMGKLNNLAGETGHSVSRLSRELTVTAQNLEKATENLNRLTELIADHPSQLIFGEPPPPRFPEPRR